MKLSIVIICLNEELHLPKCLETIRRLDHCGLEVDILVVDGGSTDSSREIARSYGARVLRSPKGIPIQRNVGGRAADGDLLAYVDADVELVEGWFGAVAHHFAAERMLLMGYPSRLPDDASWIAKAYVLHWGPAQGQAAQDGEESNNKRLLSTQNLIMGREVFDRVGGFREDLGVDEDTYFIRAATEAGIRLVCDPRLACIHHGEPKTLHEFIKRVAWGANYSQWFDAIRRGDLAQVWRPQYIYGAVVGVEVACLGASLALPIGGWQIGLPLALGALGATIVLPAINTAKRHRALDKVGDLCLMYGAYGLATMGSMIGIGRNKARRWR